MISSKIFREIGKIFLEAHKLPLKEREFTFFLALCRECNSHINAEVCGQLRESVKDPRTHALFDALEIEQMASSGVYGTQNGLLADWREACPRWGDPTVQSPRIEAALAIGRKHGLLDLFDRLATTV